MNIFLLSLVRDLCFQFPYYLQVANLYLWFQYTIFFMILNILFVILDYIF